ncbi:unnamed protein product [Zymoseptoria tritici ST99CH_1A5]|uniref:C4-dicarboxylate transporter/malic acid transport protein n=1 Tax=Zymoseptoria tritici ST99CH_1A5 TaxID=1276529 RepID=A0A1Y6LLW4_ZYMTR|nr:unnamed protein product [Zymoseptoria tritici ST99CH_1A5]
MSDETSDDSTSQSGTLENGHASRNTKQHSDLSSDRHRLPFGQWCVERVSWSWFTCTQSTGGIASVLANSPKTFSGLQTIGTIVFIFNLVLFLIFLALTGVRWYHDPKRFAKSFVTAPDCYFFGSFWLTIATIIIDIEGYGVPHAGPWLVTVVRVLFWLYAAVTLLNTTVHLSLVFRAQTMKANDFKVPAFLQVLNAMLTGTVAATIVHSQPVEHRLPIMVAGVAYQGLGWIVCTFFLTMLIASLFENGWPPLNLRPGLFIMTGTSGFTIVALIGIARAGPTTPYGYFNTHPMAGEVLLILATWTGVFMWVFTAWVFLVAVFVNLMELFERKDGKWRLTMDFTNVAWSYIFPNVGFTLSTVYLGQEFESQGIQWLSVAMIILLMAFWLLNLVMMAKKVFISIFVDSRVKLA